MVRINYKALHYVVISIHFSVLFSDAINLHSSFSQPPVRGKLTLPSYVRVVLNNTDLLRFF